MHVVPHQGQWAVEHERERPPISIHPTQREAEQAAKRHAREHGDPEVIIHDRRGRIRDSDTMDPAHESPVRDRMR